MKLGPLLLLIPTFDMVVGVISVYSGNLYWVRPSEKQLFPETPSLRVLMRRILMG